MRDSDGCTGVVVGKGSLERASALLCASVERNSMWYLYAERSITHLCSLAAATAGTPFFGPSMLTRGLWSVTSVKSRPYKYM